MARRLGFLIVALGLLLHWSHAGLDHYCDPMQPPEPPRGICGQELANTVEAICQSGRRSRRWGRENVSQLKKRVSMLLKTRAKRTIKPRGIVCECCVHRCTVAEFREYCPI
uniref:Insulin-related protein n=1 Tax=Conus ermineus TaxID=55423 RepID=A0A346CID9_CONER|nr:insulin-related protein [Conus ermineus]